jgi:UDP-glucose 4,6-dehydratase
VRKIVITGGAGFIGSHVAERIVEAYPDADITILDKMTYAADIENIAHILKRGQRRLHVGDVVDFDLCRKLTERADCVVHLAAESHVDNSFGNSLRFTQSNTLGTHALLEACRLNKVARFLHVSTDEVYGEIANGLHSEDDALNPTNPYSASKAAADMIVNSYIHCFQSPIVSVRANNIYGIRQFPEKVIPRFCMQALSGEKLTIHGNGLNRRRYLAAPDFADAIVLLLNAGTDGCIYNIGSDDEFTNADIATMIASEFGLTFQQAAVFVEDRPFNDCRYAIDCSKIKSLGWRATRPLTKHMAELVNWYRDNAQRYADLFNIPPGAAGPAKAK